MEFWSGVMEWHVGVKFWSGMKSDFKFYVALAFTHNIYGIHVIIHSQPLSNTLPTLIRILISRLQRDCVIC